MKDLTVTSGILNTQVGGSHYQLPIQPVDFIVKNGIPYREGNAIKYIVRHQSKNGKEDIKKAIHYLQMILEDYENESTTDLDLVPLGSEPAVKYPRR